MSDSYKLIKYSKSYDIIIYQNEIKENEPQSNNEIKISLKCILIKLIIFILIFLFVFIFFYTKNKNSDEKNNSNENNNNNNIDINNDVIDDDANKIFIQENQERIDHKKLCKKLDPIEMFKLRIKNGPKIICQNEYSKHICYQNTKGYYNDILWHPNGTICIMKNITLDPSKSKKSEYIYKGPVDPDKLGFPILSKGFFNMGCKNPNNLDTINSIYNTYFDSWNYKYKNKNEKIKELAPGKTILFLSRNQDSPNLFHGNSEIVNVISMIDIFKLKPENIQVIFLESLTINNDPFYEIYEKLISRGGKPIYINNFHISSAIHIPINWDSPCFFKSDYSNYEIPKPECKTPSKTYKLYNDLVDKYLNISNFIDSFISDKETFYYPKSVIKYHKSKKNFTKKVTIQWRRVWPKGRTGQGRLIGNGKNLADKLASILPKNILIRLVNTASLPMKEQISIMRNTDYLVGIHGAGLSLSIFMPNKSILHEILHSENINVLRMMSSISGHKTYSDILNAEVKNIDENEYIFFNVDDFGDKVLEHMKENHFI